MHSFDWLVRLVVLIKGVAMSSTLITPCAELVISRL